jgi:hypothetical protein
MKIVDPPEKRASLLSDYWKRFGSLSTEVLFYKATHYICKQDTCPSLHHAGYWR